MFGIKSQCPGIYRDSPVSVVLISAVPGLVLFPDLVRFFPKKLQFSKEIQLSFSTFFQHLLYYKREVRIPVVIQAKSCIKFCQDKICDR